MASSTNPKTYIETIEERFRRGLKTNHIVAQQLRDFAQEIRDSDNIGDRTLLNIVNNVLLEHELATLSLGEGQNNNPTTANNGGAEQKPAPTKDVKSQTLDQEVDEDVQMS